LLVFLIGCSLSAQNPPAPELPPTKPLEVPARIGITGEMNLTLPEVIQKVLDNDRDLAVSRIAVQEAVFNVTGAKGYFDPVFSTNAYKLRSVTPVASVFGGSADGKVTQKTLSADPQVSGELPWLGTTYSIDFLSQKQSTDSTFVTLNPQFPTSLNLNLTQPLWRGLLFDQNRYRIQVAKKNVALTNEQLRQRVIETVTQAVQDYWELDFAHRNLDVQIEAVRLAEQQDASNRRQVKQGVLANVDVIQTQTQMATFQQNVFTAQEALTRAETALKGLMLASKDDAMWAQALVPVTAIDLNVNIPPLSDAMKEALANRPEIAQSKVNVELNTLDTRLDRELAKPQINAVAKLSVQGLAGREAPVATSPILTELGLSPTALPAIFNGGYGQSLDNLYNGLFPTVQVGVQMSLPIRNRTAMSNVAVGVAEGKRLAAQSQMVELSVAADVRNTLQGVAAARARLDSAVAARTFAEDQYLSEQRQFQAGTSSVFLVLQRQTDLISARSREIRASADLGKAAADLERATARTLTVRGISLAGK
jgi:HAE1 family hydrophobic/amphiphilic exporter-1